jgi:uroporphyrinogen-III synthase
LRRYGLQADFGPSHTNGTIVAELSRNPNQRVLLPYSNAKLPDLVEALQRQGTQIEMVMAYAVQSAEPHSIGLAALLSGEVDVATFISPSGLTGLATILNGHKLSDVLAPLTVACIGPATADTAHALGVRVDLVAKKHTVDGLIESLLEWRVNRQ